jgi:integrase
VFNDGVREFDLRDARNPFEQVKIAGEGEDANNRIVYSGDALRAIAEACQARDDDIRWIVAMVADTGARNSEIVGLRVEDVFLGAAPVPHIWLREHQRVGRTLKNQQSVRKVPLVGMALWGAKRAMKAAGAGGIDWLFPRYSADNDIRSSSASQTIVKWLRSVTKTKGDTHALRHKMRDRLRHVDAPADIQDEIGGWGTRTEGQRYGEGYRLEQLQGWLKKVVVVEPPDDSS